MVRLLKPLNGWWDCPRPSAKADQCPREDHRNALNRSFFRGVLVREFEAKTPWSNAKMLFVHAFLAGETDNNCPYPNFLLRLPIMSP